MNSELPRWDVEILFPGFDSPAFQDAVATLERDRATLADIVTRLEAGETGVVDECLARLGALLDHARLVRGYAAARVATDSRDEEAQTALSRLQPQMAALGVVRTRMEAALGALSETALEASEQAREHAFYVERARVRARHQMPAGEEELAALLELSGGRAWSRLHRDVTSQLLVPFEQEGQSVLPMSAVRALASDPDRAVRRRAFEAELEAWRTVEVPLAAALNGVKGESLTLATRRGWKSPLDEALFGNAIDRATLDALLGAARDSFPAWRGYLRAKAHLVAGEATLAWFDLFAPIEMPASGEANGAGNATDEAWSWDGTRTFLAQHFAAYSDGLRDFGERAHEEHWIDAGPRSGKSDGAFCMGVRGDESRVLMNFRPSFGGVRTLAHELGHAYHNVQLARRGALDRFTPMTLAETASTFLETLAARAALDAARERGDTAEELAILEGSLQGACQVVVDIVSRFDFESAVFERRRERELVPSELCELMLEAQRQSYGDALDGERLHPYMWAAKPHYYGSNFYNFPYLFGLLFGLGLYARYEAEPDAFRASYDELLASTGQADAPTLCARFGMDVRDGAFWQSALDVLRADIERFQFLAASA